jgi:hypothetical protein
MSERTGRDIPQFAQTFLQRLRDVRSTRHRVENAKPVHSLRLLRLADEWRGDDPDSEGDRERSACDLHAEYPVS